MQEEKRYKAISLFSGAGGDTLGLETAGFDVVAFAEYWDIASKTHIENFPNSKPISNGDVTKITTDDLKDYVGNIDLIFAGFPCQGFSSAGKRDANDPRNKLFYEFLRIVDVIRPEFIVGENVTGLMTMRTNDGFNSVASEIIREFNNIGYRMETKILCAADYGAPTMRKRLIFLGRRTSGPLRFPEKTNFPIEQTSLDGSQLKAYRNVRQTINKLPNISDRFLSINLRQRLAKLESGVEKIYDYNVRGNRIDADSPMCTITATDNDYIHPFYDRFLNTEELKLLQSFPLDYQFHGDRTEVIRQIGNSVAPLMAQAIGYEVIRIMEESNGRNESSIKNESGERRPAERQQRLSADSGAEKSETIEREVVSQQIGTLEES